MSKIPLEVVVRELSKTVIGSIIACIMSGKFKDASDKPLTLGEEPLGLMTLYERACSTVAEEACVAYHKIMQKLCFSDNDKYQRTILSNRNKQAVDLLAISIRERLNDFTCFSLRKGFQIVGTRKTSSSGSGNLKVTYISGDGSFDQISIDLLKHAPPE